MQVMVNSDFKKQIICSDDETFVVEPAQLQAEIQNYMQQTPMGRCFVRPSGTGDIIRCIIVYFIINLMFRGCSSHLCGGVNPRRR